MASPVMIQIAPLLALRRFWLDNAISNTDFRCFEIMCCFEIVRLQFFIGVRFKELSAFGVKEVPGIASLEVMSACMLLVAVTAHFNLIYHFKI